MRRYILILASAGAALAAASPAAAQYYPGPQGYNNGYGYNGYGYNGYGYNYGEARQLHQRIDAIENQIRYLDQRNIIRGDSADRLRDQAHWLERRLDRASRNGLNPYEANEMRARIADLEQRVHYAAADRYGYGDRDDRWGDRD